MEGEDPVQTLVRVHDEGEEEVNLDILASRGCAVPLPPTVHDWQGLVRWLIQDHEVKQFLTKAITMVPLSQVPVAHTSLQWFPIPDAGSMPKMPLDPGIIHFRAAGKRQATASSEEGSPDLVAAEIAFQLEYQDLGNVDTLHEALQCTLEMKKQFYAPTVGLFQSSGWGKSRTACELWKKGVWVAYCSFANPTGSGWPRRSWIAPWFLEQCSELLNRAPGLQGQIACMNFCLFFFIACIRIVQLDMQKGESTCEGFVTDMWKGGERFWKRVKSHIEMFQKQTVKGLDEVEKTAELTWNNWEPKAEMLVNKSCSLQWAPYKLHMLFVFDEARHLVKSNLFLPIRRSTRSLYSLGVCALFMDTSAEITNFAPLDSADASDRVSSGHHKIAPPIWGCFSADLSEENGLHPPFTTNKFRDIVNPIRAVKYGRPLWWAIFKANLEVSSSAGQESYELAYWRAYQQAYKLAKDKLLGGRGQWDAYIINNKRSSLLTADAALALLGATIGIDVDPRSKFASRLTANNLLTVISVSPSCEFVWTAWAPEPLVAMGATEAVRELHAARRYQELYSPLVEGLQAGWVDRGYQGELAARIILLIAMDNAVQSIDSCDACTVDVFCEHLCGQSLLQLLGRDPTENERKLANARLHFTSFRRIYKKSSELTFEDVKMCLERKCAVICSAGTWGDDIWMFAFTGSDDEELREDNVIVIHGQVKLKTGNDTHIWLAKISPQYTGLKVAANLPYLSLYMNVMDKGERVKGAHWVDPREIETTVMSSNYKPICKALKEIEKEQASSGLLKEIEKEQASSEQPRAGFTDTDGQELKVPAEVMAEVMGTVSIEQSEPNFVEGGRKRENPAFQDIEGGQKKQKLVIQDIDEGQKKKEPAVQAWKAWLKAERDLQTVVVVKELNSFKLDNELKDLLRTIVTASKNPFRTDPKDELHSKLLTFQKSKLKDMFKVVNLDNYE